MINTQIITACKKGEKQSYALLYKACAPYVYGVIKRYIADMEFRRDIMQEVFAKVFLQIKTYRKEEGDFKGWIRKVSVNECLLHLRKKRILFVQYKAEQHTEVLADESILPTDLSRADIEMILEKMPVGYRLVFMLSIMDGYKHKEIAKSLNITTETSRSQLTRAKQWIKRYLSSQKKRDMYGLL